MSDSVTQLRTLITDAVRRRTFRKAVLSSPRSSSEPCRRTDVRPIELNAGPHLQFTGSTPTQQFHRNLSLEASIDELWRLICDVYAQVRVVTDAGVWSARWTRRGACLLSQEGPSHTAPAIRDGGDCRIGPSDVPGEDTPVRDPVACAPRASASHNRQRQYLIPDGVPCPFLIETGVMAPDGSVRADRYHKFRQINRYLEFIQDAMNHLPTEGLIHIVDFGCGKSYLTFATHYLITVVLRRECRIMGLDRRADVIATCRRTVDRLSLQGIEFQQGDITEYEPQGPVHLAISLHACDTATDDALNQAVRWNTDVILAVPCCQHELAVALSSNVLKPILDHGILRDRFAELATDAMRATVLKLHGYDSRVMEFIELEHTARNVLIRAVRRSQSTPPARVAALRSQLSELRRLLGTGPLRLECVLQDPGPANSPDFSGSSGDPSAPCEKDVRIPS